MSGKQAYSKGAAVAWQGEELDSHWDLVFQDALLDVAAVMAGTEPLPSAAPMKPAPARLALTLHWNSREPVQRNN